MFGLKIRDHIKVTLSAMALAWVIGGTGGQALAQVPSSTTSDQSTNRLDVRMEDGEIASHPFQTSVAGGYQRTTESEAGRSQGGTISGSIGTNLQIEGTCGTTRSDNSVCYGFTLVPQLEVRADLRTPQEDESGSASLSRLDVDAEGIALFRLRLAGRAEGRADRIRGNSIELRFGELGYRHLELPDQDFSQDTLRVRPVSLRLHSASRFRGTRTQIDLVAEVSPGAEIGEFSIGDRTRYVGLGGQASLELGLLIEDTVRIANRVEVDGEGMASERENPRISSAPTEGRIRFADTVTLHGPMLSDSDIRPFIAYRYEREHVMVSPIAGVPAVDAPRETHTLSAGLAY